MKTVIQSIKALSLVVIILGHNCALMGMSRFNPKEQEELRLERLKAEKDYYDYLKKMRAITIQAGVITIQAACRGYNTRNETKKLENKNDQERRIEWAVQNPNCATKSFIIQTTEQYAKNHYEILDEKTISDGMQWIEKIKQTITDQETITWFDSVKNVCDWTVNTIAANKFLKNEFESHWEMIEPQNKTDDTPLLLVSLHGTFADPAEAGKDKKSKNSKYITDYGQWLANTHGNYVDFLVFQWTAANTETSRQESGIELANIIIKYLKKYDAPKTGKVKLFSVTHSWGGAVMQYAARKVFEETGIEFEVGIQTACPVPHVERTSGEHYHFKKLVQFYSNADLTQVLGSTGTFSQPLGRKMPLLIDNDHKVWNVRIIDDGQELNHINIKWKTMEQAPQLLTTLLENYPNQFDLDACIVPDDKIKQCRIDKNILMCVRIRGDVPMDSKQEHFSACNNILFKNMYGYDMGDKSGFLKRMINLCIKSPFYGLFTASYDAWLDSDEQPK